MAKITNKIIIFNCLLIINLFIPNPSKAQTLIEVLNYALTTNPELLGKEAERYQTNGDRRVAYAGYLPGVDLRVGLGRDRNDNPSTQASNGSSVTLNKREVELSLSQMLFDGFAVMSNVEANEARVNSAAKDVSATLENLLLRTIEVYLEVLRYNTIVNYAKDNLVNHQNIYQQIQLRVQSGLAKKADIDQATGRLALARTNLLESQANLRDAQTNFMRVVGMSAQVLVKPDMPQELLPATEEAALALAFKDNPNLQKAQIDILAARADKRKTMAAYYPNLNLELSSSDTRNEGGVAGKYDNFNVMLRANYNLFRGGADRAREKTASWNIERVKENYRNLHRQIEQSIRISWNAYTSAHAQLGFRKEHMEATQRTRDSYKDQFMIGQRTLLDLLDSENELFSSRSSYISVQYTELLGRYRVLQGINKLAKHFGITLPDAAKYQPGGWNDGF